MFTELEQVERRIYMKHKFMSLVYFAFLIILTTPVWSQDLMIYPAQGQSQDRMEKDKFECYSWAKRESGFDPMETPKATTPPPQTKEPTAGVGRGAVGGGLVGLGVGAITGKPGRGAAVGAASGGVIGGVRRNRQRNQAQQQQKQWEQQQAQIYMQNRNMYNRAYSACLEGRGYTVK
ncbi:MAG: hypothetical protein KJP23_16385 [Deltaproteobacteria bacterium]|nr:hypothetical protein [Deltaproteobacteria bacterium]